METGHVAGVGAGGGDWEIGTHIDPACVREAASTAQELGSCPGGTRGGCGWRGLTRKGMDVCI